MLITYIFYFIIKIKGIGDWGFGVWGGGGGGGRPPHPTPTTTHHQTQPNKKKN